ncbi:hypothetical protein J2785_005337 [Burkholderia ambifaria]|uniref:Uncharacterized protein n=1 Tax=Burkholderia pyrrocinia TaxID=60550 RepID=A0A318HZM2_BURPY|nr:hypothetical protein [Burkholderia ambifaria]PXX23812.1 hypothetical protein NA66_103328 [Burkholderia pyrrocinia]SFW87900.1 hypothetical protein SAMN03159384_06532 [Burkholderia sp. NFACC33-1]SFY46083.1 hypothetical protein SAMN03159408_06618 [Burkholderia sp. NFPP32]
MKFLSRGCGNDLRPPAALLTFLQYAYAKPTDHLRRLYRVSSSATRLRSAGGMS